MDSVVRFLEGKLRLRVNRQTSAVAPVGKRKFLGHRLLLNRKLSLAPTTVPRAQEKIRQITRRNRGVSLEQVIEQLNAFLRGWLQYFRYAACRGELQRLDAWIRRKLRTCHLKQRKRGKSIADFLQQLGVPADQAWRIASSGKAWWRLATSAPVKRAMDYEWLAAQGFFCLTTRYDALRS
jgi:RNA-directed DNA polymerase